MSEIEGETPPTFGALALDPFPATTACSWPVAYVDCKGGCEDVWGNWAEGERAAAKAWFEAQAVELLWEWTGRIYGLCDVIARPCRDDCDGGRDGSSTFWGRGPGYDPTFPRAGRGPGAGGWMPVMIRGEWFNVGCGCLSACSCGISGAQMLHLPGPIDSVQQVTIDGEVLPPTAYRIDNRRTLIRTDGGTWPSCQDLLAPSTDENTFEVQYRRGLPAPVGGQVAAGRLACELALMACDSDECALPERLQTVSRQGITVGVALTGESWHDTGIWSIDSWVAAVTRPKSFASVRSVDVRPTFGRR